MSIRKSLARFARAEDGTVVVLWAAAMVAVLGFFALIFDVGRMNTTHGELQAFADNVALAAAGELDGRSTSITRANAAAANLISDSQTFANGANALAGTVDFTLTYHTELPGSDTTALGANATTDPKKAAFVEVVVTPRAVPMVFATALRRMLAINQADYAPNVTASAVAGFAQEACDITPLMFCLPNSSYSAAANLGGLIHLRTGGSGAAWGPGDFGFLDPASAEALGSTCAGVNGLNNLVTCLVGAVQNISSCYSTRGVDIQPGQAVGVWNDAINMRFDRYPSSLKKKRNDPDYPPAPVTISGEVGGCANTQVTASSDTMSLPIDTCIGVSCDRFGDGNWDYDSYIDTNYGDGDGTRFDATNGNAEDAHLTGFDVAAPSGSRYETYLRELAYLDSLPDGSSLLVDRDETGIPQCYQNAATADASRRVMIAAGIDCTENPINGAETDVPVAEFFEVFLTRPVGAGTGSPAKFDLFVEVIGSAGLAGYTSAGTGGIFRDVVQLYR